MSPGAANSQCERIQEEIAWCRGEELDPASLLHVLDCAACRKLVTDFTLLDSVFHDRGNGSGDAGVVSEGFADRVMTQVMGDAGRMESIPQRVVKRVRRAFPKQPGRLRLAYASVALLALLALAPAAI